MWRSQFLSVMFHLDTEHCTWHIRISWCINCICTQLSKQSRWDQQHRQWLESKIKRFIKCCTILCVCSWISEMLKVKWKEYSEPWGTHWRKSLLHLKLTEKRRSLKMWLCSDSEAVRRYWNSIEYAEQSTTW